MDELCGVEGQDRARAGHETIEQHVERLTQHAIDRWRSALAASGDPRRQAIGLALTNAVPGGPVITDEELVPGNEPSKDTPANNNLVLLAVETGDPTIYSLALGLCKNTLTDDMASGPCAGLSWEHWASIDPDNGMPWLWIAAKAEQSGEQQAVENALAKASTAARIESYGSTVNGLALGALPGDAAPLEKAVAGADVWYTLHVGVPLELVSLCAASAIQQPVRKQQCSAIATILAKAGPTYMDLAIASHLADRLGFPEETRAALKAERQNGRAALNGLFPWQNSNNGSVFRCDVVLAFDRFIDALRANGGNERAALRAVMQARQQERNSSAGR